MRFENFTEEWQESFDGGETEKENSEEKLSRVYIHRAALTQLPIDIITLSISLTNEERRAKVEKKKIANRTILFDLLELLRNRRNN